ncbi:MAG: tripartite tricarboxylate transporter substrate binding protein [Betaproteobacteria bacterium]|nr:tripartite tricarboxylate transporter substrate binding protein [Betaproteobacteria bacterium]
MKVSRRAALAAIGSALLLSRIGARAADAYPAKPVRLVVAWPPGSSADTSARLLAQKLGESLGQSFVVDNRPGASGIIGTESVLRAPADGYTLLFNTANHASNKVVFPKLSYDPVADFMPVSMVHRNVLSVSVHPSLPVKTLEDFLQYAKAKPGTLSFGTPGLGTPHQLAGELLKQRAGIDMVHIPYKGGGPAVADLLSGQIPVSVASLAAVMPFMRTGRVRVVAVTDPTRYDEIKDVAAVAETFSGFDVSGWSGLFALAGTPPEIVARLNAEVMRILNLPDTRRSMTAAGLVASVSTPEALGKLVRDDIERWMLVVKSGVRFS